MDDNDSMSLAKLARNISDAAGEAVKVTEDVYRARKHPAVEIVYKEYSCFAEACELLSSELANVDMRTSEWDSKFWTSVRLVLELWHRNTLTDLGRIRRHKKRLSSTWTGWIWSNSQFTHLVEEYGIVDVRVRMQDAQMIITLLQLYALPAFHHPYEKFAKDYAGRQNCISQADFAFESS